MTSNSLLRTNNKCCISRKNPFKQNPSTILNFNRIKCAVFNANKQNNAFNKIFKYRLSLNGAHTVRTVVFFLAFKLK